MSRTATRPSPTARTPFSSRVRPPLVTSKRTSLNVTGAAVSTGASGVGAGAGAGAGAAALVAASFGAVPRAVRVGLAPVAAFAAASVVLAEPRPSDFGAAGTEPAVAATPRSGPVEVTGFVPVAGGVATFSADAPSADGPGAGGGVGGAGEDGSETVGDGVDGAAAALVVEGTAPKGNCCGNPLPRSASTARTATPRISTPATAASATRCVRPRITVVVVRSSAGLAAVTGVGALAAGVAATSRDDVAIGVATALPVARDCPPLA